MDCRGLESRSVGDGVHRVVSLTTGRREEPMGDDGIREVEPA